ncbi:MAG: FAD-dependent oxidoreductase [Archangium sp.]|nr:FAD-dependent oxidoreductase [Archangium sp.]
MSSQVSVTTPEVIVIGAGVAGLECARTLAAGGRRVLVVDRARGVGGRCATRRFEQQPVDFGPLFLHGSDAAFLAAIASVPGVTPLADWPHRVEGRGAPCQPASFNPGERRFAFAEGLAAFPRHLAQGLTVKLSTRVVRLSAGERTFLVHTEAGEVLEASDVVVALALEQSRALLGTLPQTPEVAGALGLLGMFASVPSLTLIAGYGLETPAPAWDVQYPEDSDCLQLIANDSAKRKAPRARVLVLQARPRWSRQRLELPAETWAAELLAEAAGRVGAWAAQPLFSAPHRWSYARVERGSELAQPLSLSLPGGQRLGLAGDLFAPGGGVQAAWLSGNHLAQRLLQENP